MLKLFKYGFPVIVAMLMAFKIIPIGVGFVLGLLWIIICIMILKDNLL
jgi:hypothetical protein